MIPKNIFTTMVFDPAKDPFQKKHYDTFFKCFESWFKLMPDYDIRIINIENVFEFGADDWVMDRIEEGNFIAVSHWARLKWLYEEGGIYADMDIEAVKRFDGVRENRFFAGHEGGDAYINNAIMGARPLHPFVREMMAYTQTFPLTHPEWPNETGPRMITKLMRDRKWSAANETQHFDNNDITIYRSQVCYPYFWKESFHPACIADDTVCVHHWASSWT